MPPLESPPPLRDVLPLPVYGERVGVRGSGMLRSARRKLLPLTLPSPHGRVGRGETARSGETAPSVATPGSRPRTASRCPSARRSCQEALACRARCTSPAATAPLGLRLEAGEAIDDIAADLPRFALIALGFPKFSDGRAFSTARLLREKHGYTGELRAVGNVLSDQIPLMRRVGFDTFEVTHAPTRRALIEGRIAEVALHYQPAAPSELVGRGPRPWLRRTQTSSVVSKGSE